jgi:hypothetical protein
MDITSPLRDLLQFEIQGCQDLILRAGEALEAVERIQRLADRAPPEVFEKIARSLLLYLKPIFGEHKKKQPEVNTQIDEILRVIKKVGYQLGTEDRMPAPAELTSMKARAKAAVDRRLEKDMSVQRLDKKTRERLRLRAHELSKHRC